MVGEDTDVGGDDDVDDLMKCCEMWRVNSMVKVGMTCSYKL
jgi:hypothetical protein